MRRLIMLLPVLAGCGPTLEDSWSDQARATQAIVGGVTAPGDPAVVALAVGVQGGFSQYCTGTLVGARTVLTAAHCIYAEGQGDYYYVLFGANADAPKSWVKVKSQNQDPSYDGATHDFGVLQLATAVTTVVPIEMNMVPMTQADIGKSIRHVGFGTTSGSRNDSGIKRQVTFAVRAVGPATIESGAAGKQTCSGDSGGPGLMVTAGSPLERVVGVVSYGDAACANEGIDGRVDFGLSWVKGVMSRWEGPSCFEDNQCVPNCAPVDPDCACVADGQCTADCVNPARDPDCPANCGADGVCAAARCPRPDPDCTPDGSACTTASVCQGRSCVGDAQHQGTYCSRACTAAADCPEQMQCTAGSCVLAQRPERSPFETCTAADFCTGGTGCNGPSGKLSRCVASCVNTADCQAGAVCEGGATGQRYCRPPADQLSFDDVKLPLATGEGPAASTCASVGGGAWAMLALARLLRRRRECHA